jgi:hypothetical protein
MFGAPSLDPYNRRARAYPNAETIQHTLMLHVRIKSSQKGDPINENRQDRTICD